MPATAAADPEIKRLIVLLYTEDEMPPDKVCRVLEVPYRLVWDVLKEEDVLRRGHGYESHPVRYVEHNGCRLQLRGRHGPEKVRAVLEAYEDGGEPQQLSERFDVPVSTLENWCDRTGIRRSQTEAAASRLVNDGYRSPIALRKKAARLYTEEKMPVHDVADRMDVCHTAVIKYLQQEGIEARSRSEAQILHHYGSMANYRAFCRRCGYMRYKGESIAAIAREMDTSWPAVDKAIKSDYNPYRD